MAARKGKTCTLRFFVKVVPATSKPSAVFSPNLTVIWRMGWEGAAGATSGKAGAKRLDVDVANVKNASGGFLGDTVRYELLKLNPRIIKTDAQARALLKDKSFTWKDNALAISLHTLDVGLSNAAESDPVCTACP